MPSNGCEMGGRKVLWALGFLLLLQAAKSTWEPVQPASHQGTSQAEKGIPRGFHQPRSDRCPPPPQTLPPGACQVIHCQADSQCPRHWRCCYNGCTYACLEAVPLPPAEACSTTEDGLEPLLCPSGYECHILSPGDMAKGIPNRGQCVKQRQQADGRFLRDKFYKEDPEGDSKKVQNPGRDHRGTFNKRTGGLFKNTPLLSAKPWRVRKTV